MGCNAPLFVPLQIKCFVLAYYDLEKVKLVYMVNPDVKDG